MSTVTSWVERLAAELLDLDAELRPLLRSQRGATARLKRKDGRVSTRRGETHDAISLSPQEVRTLLRAAMPVPVATSRRLRGPHARMLAALSVFAAKLLPLTQSFDAAGDAAAAGVQLAEELRLWIEKTRWQQATTAACVRGWHRPDSDARVGINEILELQTGRKRNTAGTQTGLPGLDLVGLAAGVDPVHLRLQRLRRREREQLAMRLESDTTAAIVTPIGVSAVPIAAASAVAAPDQAPRRRRRQAA